MGLLGAWVLFALAALIWWRRRHDSKKYSYTERAQIILDAIRDRLDLGMIYWSKTERKFIRRVITPLELDGYSMKAFDHSLGSNRIFKVTRIRLVEIIPTGAPKQPPSRMKLVSMPTLVAVGLGVVALALLALALVRSQGPEQLTGVLPPQIAAPGLAIPPSPQVPTPPPDALKLTAVPDVATNASLAEPVEDDFMKAPPVPVPPADTWYLLVESHPNYKPGQVAGLLQTVLRYKMERAVELEQSVQQLGRAVVWSGPKERAEKCRQMLESYDLVAKLEHSGTRSNVTATATNVAPGRALPPN